MEAAVGGLSVRVGGESPSHLLAQTHFPGWRKSRALGKPILCGQQVQEGAWLVGSKPQRESVGKPKPELSSPPSGSSAVGRQESIQGRGQLAAHRPLLN